MRFFLDVGSVKKKHYPKTSKAVGSYRLFTSFGLARSSTTSGTSAEEFLTTATNVEDFRNIYDDEVQSCMHTDGWNI